jgi:hypothetical protein
VPNRHHLFSDKIAPNYQQLVSNIRMLNDKQSFSDAGDVRLMSSSQNEGIRVTYHTPPTEDLLKSQTIALIAMMRG